MAQHNFKDNADSGKPCQYLIYHIRTPRICRAPVIVYPMQGLSNFADCPLS
jgi:hypothetical protein